MQADSLVGYITGDSKRIFLNTALGCNSQCAYFYLPSIGLPVGTNEMERQPADIIFEKVAQSGEVVLGKIGTTFSIGCFSECWDADNRIQTKQLI